MHGKKCLFRQGKVTILCDRGHLVAGPEGLHIWVGEKPPPGGEDPGDQEQRVSGRGVARVHKVFEALTPVRAIST